MIDVHVALLITGRHRYLIQLPYQPYIILLLMITILDDLLSAIYRMLSW